MPDMALYPGSDGWMETVCWSDDVFRLPKPPADPGVVFAVNDARTGLVVAVHRIPFRRGRPVKKADGKTLKISLGPIVGNAFRGSCRPDPYGRWGVAEGCETALAATQLVRFPVWGAISAGNMARIIPPGWARHAVIFADHDENEVGIDAAAEALAVLRRLPQLESVRVVMACEMGADANDVLRAVPYA
jgi:hypothetical protein